MKTLKFLPPFILVTILLIVPVLYASPSLTITVETSKGFYSIGESIDVFGNLTLDGSSVQYELVALGVQDPMNSPVVTRTLQTDTSGIYYVTFELSAEALLGTYKVYVSSVHNGENVTNNTIFELVPTLTITVETSKGFYSIGESIDVFGNLTLDGSSVQNELVALEVQDPNRTSVLVRTLQTDAAGTYHLTFKLPSGATVGTYTVYVSSAYMEQKAANSTTFEFTALLGDINGDGIVDIFDVVTVAIAFGSAAEDDPTTPRDETENWNPEADLVRDGVIDIFDVVTVARNFGKTA